MRPTLRLLLAELHTLLHSVRGVLLAVVLPALLLVLVGQLRVQPPSYRLLVAGVATAVPPARDDVRAALTLLREVPRFEILEDSAPVDDPLRALRERRLDAILNVGDLTSDGWALYTAETRATRLAGLEDLALHLQRALSLTADRPADASEAPGGQLEDATALGIVELTPVHAYFPRAADQSLGVLAITIALIVCFLPFALAAPGLIRDREERTLEMTLAAPGIRWWSMLVAKACATVMVTLFTFGLLMVLTGALYGVYVKPGVMALLGFGAAAMISSTALGLAVSAAATSQSQVTAASGLYFLALTVFTGVLIPLSESSSVIVAISRALPVTFVHPAIQAWMVGDGAGGVTAASAAWLAGQAAVYGAAAAILSARIVRNL